MTDCRDEGPARSWPVVASLAVLAVMLASCAAPAATAGPTTGQTTAASETLPATTQPPPDTTPTTGASSSSTVSVVAEGMAIDAGITPERAQEILDAQGAGFVALGKLPGLLGDDVVGHAWGTPIEHADELTVYVVDEAAVQKALSLLDQVGLDPDKTTVQVAPPEPPASMWDWQKEAPYSAYEWLEYPGPVMEGDWHLLSTNYGTAPTDVTVYFGTSTWNTGPCDRGDYALSTLTATLMLTIDNSNVYHQQTEDNAACPADSEIADFLLSAIRVNHGRFQLSASAGHLTWIGSEGSNLTWESLDAYGWAGTPMIADHSSRTYTRWAASIGPEIEGVWDLDQVGGVDPVTPVQLAMNGTWGATGACNWGPGVYGITTQGKLGLPGVSSSVLWGLPGPVSGKLCSGSQVQTVKGQIVAALPRLAVFDVTFEGETMTWPGPGGGLVWRRAPQTPGE